MPAESVSTGSAAWSRWLPPLVVVAAVLVTFSDALTWGRGLFFRDHTTVFRPRWSEVVAALQDGRWPHLTLAHPDGTPLETALNGTYTPATLILGLGPFDVTYDLFIVAHYVACAIGTYGLIRSLRGRTDQAVAGAAIAALAGPVVALNDTFIAMQGVAWLPFVGWAYVAFLRRPDALQVALLALASGFFMQCVTPTVALPAALMALLLTAHLRPSASGATVVGAAAATCLAALIASVELAPVLDALGETRRGAGFTYEEASKWSMHPAQLAEFLLPALWTPPDVPFFNVPSITGAATGSFLRSLYLGTAIPLAVLGLWAKPKRWVWLFSAVAVLAIATALGHHLPVHRWLTALPILESSRFPIKYTMVLAMALAPLAAFGLTTAKARPGLLIVLSALQITFLIAAAATAFLWLDLGALVTEHNAGNWPRPRGFTQVEVIDAARWALIDRFGHALTFLLAQTLVAMLMLRSDFGRGAGLLAVIVAADLAVGGRFAVPTADVAVPLATGPIRTQMSRTHPRFSAPNQNIAPRPAHAPGGDFFGEAHRSLTRRGYLGGGYGRLYRDTDPNGQSHPISGAAYRASTGPARDVVLPRAGVAWRSTWAQGAPGAIAVEMGEEVPQFFVPVPEPRPYVEAYARWATATSTGVDAQRMASLLARTATIALLFDEPTKPDDGACQPTVAPNLERAPDRIEVRVVSSCVALVVAQEVAFAGYSVTVDGAPVPLQTAELAYIAALVDPGTHDVVFAYEPDAARYVPAFFLGITAAALALMIGALARRRART